MAQRAKIHDNTPDDLSQILRIHMVEGEKGGSSKFSSDVHMCTMAHVCVSCVCVCVCIHRLNKCNVLLLSLMISILWYFCKIWFT